jgi:hypothetical protein
MQIIYLWSSVRSASGHRLAPQGSKAGLFDIVKHDKARHVGSVSGLMHAGGSAFAKTKPNLRAVDFVKTKPIRGWCILARTKPNLSGRLWKRTQNPGRGRSCENEANPGAGACCGNEPTLHKSHTAQARPFDQCSK